MGSLSPTLQHSLVSRRPLLCRTAITLKRIARCKHSVRNASNMVPILMRRARCAKRLKSNAGFTTCIRVWRRHSSTVSAPIRLRYLRAFRMWMSLSCLSGGGSGCCGAITVAKAINPNVKIIGVQAENAPAIYRSMERREARGDRFLRYHC